MPTLSDAILSSLDAQGYTTGTVNDRLYAWLNDQCQGGPAPDVPPVSSDPNIVWGNATELHTFIYDSQFSVLNNVYFYENGTGAGYHDMPSGGSDTFPKAPSINVPFNPGDYLLKYELLETVSGTEPITLNNLTGNENTWVDAFRANVQLDDNTQDDVPEEKVVKIWLAQDNGAGAPVAGTETWRKVRFTSDWETA